MNGARRAAHNISAEPRLLKLVIGAKGVIMCVDCDAHVDATDASTLAALKRVHRCRV